MRSISEILTKAMEAKYSPKGNIRQRRRRDGVIQYLVIFGSKTLWINSNHLFSPEDKKEIEAFMV